MMSSLLHCLALHTHVLLPTGLQTIVNGNLQFMDVEAGFSGRAHDMGIFKHTNFGRRGLDWLKPGFYVLADAGYAVCNTIVRPFDERENTSRQVTRLNMNISSSRMVVERAYGILKNRFRSLLRGIHVYDIQECTLWFVVAVILHNICRSSDDQDPTSHPFDDLRASVPDLPEDECDAAEQMNGMYEVTSANAVYEALSYRPVTEAEAAAIKRMDGREFREWVLLNRQYIEKEKDLKQQVQVVSLALSAAATGMGPGIGDAARVFAHQSSASASLSGHQRRRRAGSEH